jgi:hypothetical protein
MATKGIEMDKSKDGGPAFPVTDSQVLHRIASQAVLGMENGEDRDRAYIKAVAEAAKGMSLRDYFAAAAMQGLLAAETYSKHSSIANYSYDIADAMLAERAKEPA